MSRIMRYKNILYLDEKENAYTRGIRDELQRISGRVDCYFYYGIYLDPIFIRQLKPKENEKLKYKSIKLFLDFIKSNHYDIIFVGHPSLFPKYFFENIRTIFKNTPIINYNWSSIKMYNVLSYLDYFDKIYSFDRQDCRNYNLQYYPLFYLKEFENVGFKNRKIYNISFIGSAYNSGRLEFIKKWYEKVTDLNMTYFIYLFTPEIFKSVYTKIKYPKLSQFFFYHQLPMNEVVNKFSVSESMIDHPMTIQTGLTIRTFETLAAGLHLYTTNDAIRQEPFYNSDRITITDKDIKDINFNGLYKIKPDKEWQESFSVYRIDNWVRHIVCI